MVNSNSSRKGRTKNTKTKKLKISKCPRKGMVESKNSQTTQENTRGQEPQHVDSALGGLGWTVGVVLNFWRDPECDFCYICGDNHEEFFCPFNYLYGLHDLRTCKARCPPGKHLVVSARHRQFLQCFVRASNLPPNFRQWHLGSLCSAFGPMRMWHVPLNNGVCRGVGFAVFTNREHAEAAIERLNGECYGGYDVRVDWAYPYLI